MSNGAWHPGLRESYLYDRNVIAEIQRASREGIYDIRGFGAKRRLPHFDDLLFLGASVSRYPLEGYRERCGISMKGIDIVVRGSVGHLSAFMAQTGRLVVCGDAGEALGDSIYEARLYVRGEVAGLGADCVEKELRDEHVAELSDLLARAGVDGVDAREFRRYGSARQLYNFKVDNAAAY